MNRTRHEREAVRRAREHLASHTTLMTDQPCDAHALATDVIVLSREADGLKAECDVWLNASNVWGEIGRKLTDTEQRIDALLDAARRTNHGDHFYDLDVRRTDCFLCAAIEDRYRPAWMEEPYHWLRDPVVEFRR